MFTTLSSRYRARALFGSLLANFAVLLTICLPALWRPATVTKERAPQIDQPRITMMEFPKLVKPESHDEPEAQTPSHAADRIAPGDSALATPGSPRWKALVQRGRELPIEIYALESLPVLRAYGITLALDARRPRGESYLFNLRDKTLHRGGVPDAAVVRELVGMPAEFDEVRNKVEREIGQPPHMYALYPPDLYAALRSLTYEALKKRGVPVDNVTRATVRLRLVGGQSFEVSLVSEVKS